MLMRYVAGDCVAMPAGQSGDYRFGFRTQRAAAITRDALDRLSIRHPTRSFRASPGGIPPSGSYRSRPACRPRASGRDGRVPTCDSRKRAGQRRADLRAAARRDRGSTDAVAPCSRIAVASVPGRSEYGKHVQVRQRRRRQVVGFAAKSSSVSPGNPTIMSEPIDACGRRSAMPSTSASIVRRACRAGASRAACDRSRAAAAGGSAARSGRRSRPRARRSPACSPSARAS